VSKGTVLVTGGAGYVGSHVCKALARAGYLPIAFDDLRTGHADAVRWGPLVRADIADREALDATLDAQKPVACIHMAGSCYVGDSVREPDLYWRNNVSGTATLLAALRSRGITRFVFSSSCAIYAPTEVDLHEHAPTGPLSPYGRTKLVVEWMLQDIAATGALSYVALRYFNAAGADPDGEAGERHDPETHLIPLALDVAAGARSELLLFGDQHATPDGTCIRDYVHVSDIAAAHVLALSHLGRGAPAGAFNLGLGRGYSVREVVDACERVTGRAVRTRVAPPRAGDAARLVADPTRARSLLGWAPAFESLDDIIATAWRFSRARGTVAT
jgi:UDP-arabinose 4-epimerase